MSSTLPMMLPTTKAVHRYATSAGLDLPIVRAVHTILFENGGVAETIAQLMQLPVGEELAALRYR